MVGMTRAALVPELPKIGKKKSLNQDSDVSGPSLVVVSTIVSQCFACANTCYFAVMHSNLPGDEYVMNAG